MSQESQQNTYRSRLTEFHSLHNIIIVVIEDAIRDNEG